MGPALLTGLGETPPRESARLPYVRWACLATLLLVEILGLSACFDTQAVLEHPSAWASLLGYTPLAPRILIATGTAVLVFGGAKLRREITRSGGVVAGRRHRWTSLVAHLVAFGLFAGETILLFRGGLADFSYPGLLLALWLFTGFTSLALLCNAALPLANWRSLFAAGLGGIAAGVLVGVGAWGIGQVATRLWYPLGLSTLYTVHRVLRLVFRDTVFDPAAFEVGAANFVVELAPECSGYEGIGLIWALLAAYLVIDRRHLRFPNALLLIPLGTAAAWSANVLRLVSLILLGALWSPQIAAGGFHSQAGWVAFNAVGLGLIYLSKRTRFFTAHEASPDATQPQNPAVPYLAPLFTILATTMLTGLFTSGFDALYPARVLVAVAALWACRGAYRAIRPAVSWWSVAIGVAVFALWIGLEPLAPKSSGDSVVEQGLRQLPKGWAALWLVFRVIGSVITVPIAEELAFRGFLIRRLTASEFESVSPRRFTWASFLLSSVLFGLLHGRWLAGTLAGMGYALALSRRGELADAIAAHAITNALIALSVLLAGFWFLWA